MMEFEKVVGIVEAALLTADGPMQVKELAGLFNSEEIDENDSSRVVKECILELEKRCESRSIELKRVASGYRFQVKQEYGEWVGRMLKERPPRYTRALLETLSIIVYKQPVTRGDIEELRGVSVSQNIMRTLLERGWIKIVGQKEVPGRPSLYATTKGFLDYFDLKSLNELPEISEIQELVLKEAQTVENMVVQDLHLEQEGKDSSNVSQSSDEKAAGSNDEQSNVVNLPVNQ
mgnify:FL=1